MRPPLTLMNRLPGSLHGARHYASVPVYRGQTPSNLPSSHRCRDQCVAVSNRSNFTAGQRQGRRRTVIRRICRQTDFDEGHGERPQRQEYSSRDAAFIYKFRARGEGLTGTGRRHVARVDLRRDKVGGHIE